MYVLIERLLSFNTSQNCNEKSWDEEKNTEFYELIDLYTLYFFLHKAEW